MALAVEILATLTATTIPPKILPWEMSLVRLISNSVTFEFSSFIWCSTAGDGGNGGDGYSGNGGTGGAGGSISIES